MNRERIVALRDELLKSLEAPIKKRFTRAKDNEIFDLGMSTANSSAAEKLSAILAACDNCGGAGMLKSFPLMTGQPMPDVKCDHCNGSGKEPK
jgi:DnaJ-class molecular chaperone